MELAQNEPAVSWRATRRAQAHTHPYSTAGMALALTVVAWLLMMSIWRIASGEADVALRPVR